jgi:3-isopropylmalate/(R)-2-methylmalate dehydratase large subunit
MSGLTSFEKLWRSHLIRDDASGPSLPYVDRHLIYAVDSPQAFEGLNPGYALHIDLATKTIYFPDAPP